MAHIYCHTLHRGGGWAGITGMDPVTESKAEACRREGTGPKTHGLLRMTPRCTGCLQAREWREARSHEMAMSPLPLIFQNEMTPHQQCQLTKTFP